MTTENMPFDGVHFPYQQTATVQWSGVSPLVGNNLWQKSAQQKLMELAALPENWNSYGSKPILTGVIEKAANILADFGRFKISEPKIFPVAGGGLQFEWRNSNRELEIEILPDESIEFLLVDEDGEMIEGILPQRNLVAEVMLVTDLLKYGVKRNLTNYASA